VETRAARWPIIAEVDLKWAFFEQKELELSAAAPSCEAITTSEKFDSVVRSKTFQMSPFEALARTILVGSRRKAYVDRLTHEIRTRGLVSALTELSSAGENDYGFDATASSSISCISGEIQQCIHRLELGLGASALALDSATAELIEWAWGSGVTHRTWQDINGYLERATGEAIDRIFCGEIVGRGLLGRGYQRMVFNVEKPEEK
jgi:hypothetical protein